ncbi:MAG: O-methyltransferase [Desulfurobacterium sp.]|nr:MAG: O-methyltransferase [Desulfurobacterium sp.]
MKFKRWQNLSEIVPAYVEEFASDYNLREPVLVELEEFAKENKVPILLPSAAAFLRFLVSVLEPKRVLEIGTGIGYSTLNIYYGYPEAKIFTVDSNRKRIAIAKEFFKKVGAPIKLLEMDGFDAIKGFLSRGETFDLIFIDSVKSEYPFFNYKIQSLLSDRGIAVFDNVLFRGYVVKEDIPSKYERSVSLLRKFLKEVKEYPGFETFLIPIGDGLLLLKRKFVL